MIFKNDTDQYNLIDKISCSGIEIAKVFKNENLNRTIIIDNPEIFSMDFDYHHYCLSQNRLMSEGGEVLRYIEGDPDIPWLNNRDLAVETSDFISLKTYDRSGSSIDPSPLEYLFEKCFEDAYGTEALKYLVREYPLITNKGKTGYIDYTMFKKDGTWLAIEENGVMYHHPYIIKKGRYRRNLEKQNTVLLNGGRLFRWDTRALQNQEVMIEELKEAIGSLDQYKIQTSIISNRRVALHTHQKDYLEDLKTDREEGKTAALVLLPTGTGKTRIACEDIAQFRKQRDDFTTLILVPTLDLVRQWKREIEGYNGRIGKPQIFTYGGIANRYNGFEADTFNYIVVDEAHHAAAPVMRRVLEYFSPDFLLGMTATDQRLDEKRLEDIFSTYKPRLDLKEAIEKGFLVPIRAFRLESSIDLSEIRFNRKDYVGSDLERAVSVTSRNELIARCVSEYFGEELPDKQGVVFCVNVKHAKDMAAILNEYNIKAASVDGKDRDREKKIKEYMDGAIQFLCTCSLLTEGWDAPNTSVLVMARPTLSKVLYTQQLGRGTRLHPGKEFLYVIDVVDTYGAFGQVRNSPWTLHTLFESFQYLPWGVLVGQAPDKSRELIEIDTTYETVMALNPIDIFTWQKIYENYLSNEQLARELYVSTGTVNSWIGKGDIIPDQSIPMGRSTIHLFHPDSIPRIRESKGLKEHGEHTLVDDFRDFIEEGTYTFSYKIFFILAFLEVMNEDGEADINILMARYRKFYLERHENNLTVDRTNCPYNDKTYLMDDKLLQRSILQNPFEKFERKRFMSYSKDLKCISWHPKLREYFRSGEYRKELKEKMFADRDKYYRDL